VSANTADFSPQRANGIAAALPTYLPTDTIVVTGYHESMEVLRSAKLGPEPPGVNAPISGSTLMTLHGPEHIQRRRVMNRLVRPAALEQYRDDRLLPSLQRQLAELAARPDPDGKYRTDLVSFVMGTFSHFAASMIGLADIGNQDGNKRLMELFKPILLAQKAKYLHGDPGPIIQHGLEAKREYKARFYDPAVAICPHQDASGAAHGSDATVRHDLISLLVARTDQHWEDEDLALKETLVLLIGGIETSASLISHAVDELQNWLTRKPEDLALLDDPQFLSEVIQETLRLHPTQPYVSRVARDDVALTTGREVKRGQWLVCMTVEANTDPEVFGPKATTFDPHRSLPPDVPRYGTTFGGGAHQCLGVRVVLGDQGIGSHMHVLRQLMRAGVQRDPERMPHREPSVRDVYDRYPVIFATIERGLDQDSGPTRPRHGFGTMDQAAR
jgi:cytochrome P450